MQQSKLELDRCILFPWSKEAVDCIERKELDSRYEIDFIDINYSQLSKLEIFGFFSFLKDSNELVQANSFVKLNSKNIQNAIDGALVARKQTKDNGLLKLIDKFVEKANKSKQLEMPIWFNT